MYNILYYCGIAGQQATGLVIGKSLGRAQYCSFSGDDMLVAVCIDRDVLLLDTTVSNISPAVYPFEMRYGIWNMTDLPTKLTQLRAVFWCYRGQFSLQNPFYRIKIGPFLAEIRPFLCIFITTTPNHCLTAGRFYWREYVITMLQIYTLLTNQPFPIAEGKNWHNTWRSWYIC